MRQRPIVGSKSGEAMRLKMRIPTMPATHSDLMPATIPI
jgi:hypothetical protein